VGYAIAVGEVITANSEIKFQLEVLNPASIAFHRHYLERLLFLPKFGRLNRNTSK